MPGDGSALGDSRARQIIWRLAPDGSARRTDTGPIWQPSGGSRVHQPRRRQTTGVRSQTIQRMELKATMSSTRSELDRTALQDRPVLETPDDPAPCLQTGKGLRPVYLPLPPTYSLHLLYKCTSGPDLVLDLILELDDHGSSSLARAPLVEMIPLMLPTLS